MNRARIEGLNKKINKILSFKKLPIFPIMGGLSIGGTPKHTETRHLTLRKEQAARTKGTPCPILIELSREKEFLEYLK